MKTKFFHYYMPVIFFLIFSYCGKEQAIRRNVVLIDNFPRSKSLSGNVINEIREDIYPFFMGIKDSILLLCDFKSNPHFYAYETNKFSPLGEFGRQGKGPSDIQDPFFSGQIIKENDSYKIWVFQVNLMKLALIDITHALGKSFDKPDMSIILPPEVNTACNILSLDKNTFIGVGIEAEGEFFIYNSLTKIFKWKEFLVDYNTDYMNLLKKSGLLNEYKLGTLKVKPDGSLFVKASIFKPIIDVYNINCDLQFSIEIAGSEKPTINSNMRQFDETRMLYYANIYLSNNYIYALNQNCSLEEQNSNNCSNTEIHVFDWNGKAICKFLLNEPISSLGPFVIDEKNKQIILFSPKIESNSYYRFSIGSELFKL